MGPEVLQYMSLAEIVSLAHESFDDLLPRGDEIKITVGASGEGGKCIHFYVDGDKNATILREAIPAKYSGLDTIVIYTQDNRE